MNRNRLDTCIDWVLCAVLVICLVMMGFSAGCGDDRLAGSFAMNLVCVAVLMITRKEVGDEQK
ncbi:hypothetical protein [uncultured Porphyromonas sp.]|uniref:hypothetical protein n=1 Tax=uncultured Porphyromonas sp. TaxID=159274 RepID=UPI00259710DD|nr:hypothetical protein [uncultured Porphyromonas sp.]